MTARIPHRERNRDRPDGLLYPVGGSRIADGTRQDNPNRDSGAHGWPDPRMSSNADKFISHLRINSLFDCVDLELFLMRLGTRLVLLEKTTPRPPGHRPALVLTAFTPIARAIARYRSV